MSEPVHVVHLEDRPLDAELVEAALADSGLDLELVRVDNRGAFEKALERGPVDLILSDFALPGFDGLAALELAQTRHPDVPFILVSGTMGEEAAINSLRSGATDYVLKHRLTRLGPAVRRALEEAAERRTRRTAEAMLERERNFLRALLDSLEAGVVACDREGILTVFNRATRELHGLPDAPPPPDQWADYYELFAADGSTPLAPTDVPLQRALRGERLRNVEITIRHRNGAARTVLASGQPIADDGGRRLGAVVALHDITGRKQLEAQFRQAQKMEAMGLLAAGVAHDFNNILTVITGFCELLRGRLDAAHPALADVEEIANAGRRAGDLTRQLLAFSRRQVLETRVLDLNTIVGSVNGMLHRVIGSGIDLVFAPAQGLGHILADAGQIEQVLLNLVINARDAMPKGGRITIRTANSVVREPRAAGHEVASPADGGGSLHLPFEIPPGEYVTLTVSDNGCGMDHETAAQVFVPFFTTKEFGHGTGLGLSTVHGIVTQSGGFLALETTPNVGTSFTLYLPLAAGEREATVDAPTESAVARGCETILVVDDEPAIRSLVGEILRRDGYTVLQAEDGEAAASLVERDPAAVDALVLDLAMPGLSGRELCARIRRARPDLPILLMSGHGGKDAESLLSSLGFEVNYVQKPFTPAEFKRRVRDTLADPPARAA